VSWIHSLPSLGDQSSIWSLSAQWYIQKEKFNNSSSWKSEENLFKHIFIYFLVLACIQIHNHAYYLVGIYFEKTGYKHKWHKLHFTEQQRTDNNGLVFKCCILLKMIVKYNKNSTSYIISRLFTI
jgi:hypothetical protein